MVPGRKGELELEIERGNELEQELEQLGEADDG